MGNGERSTRVHWQWADEQPPERVTVWRAGYGNTLWEQDYVPASQFAGAVGEIEALRHRRILDLQDAIESALTVPLPCDVETELRRVLHG